MRQQSAGSLLALRNAADQAMLGTSAYEAKRPRPGGGMAENRRVEFRFLLTSPGKYEIAAAAGNPK